MTRTMTATEARVRFGELMRRVSQGREVVVVERGGQPMVVMLSVPEYEGLRSSAQAENWRGSLDRALATGQRLREGRAGVPLTPSEQVLDQTRGVRDDELMGLH